MSAPNKTLARTLATLAAGALFGFGLSYSSMIRPEVVLSFLRFEDFGLMLVMGGAVMVALLAYKLVPRLLARPLLDDHFHKHPSVWNRDTAVGAALFGVGWGLCGVCPGPAIAGLGAGNWDLLWALAGIALGALVQGLRAK
ncbi:MAG: YeeE/YedE thiosulfate transporter family protein [Polaromonas sp.]|nr:YeeE/YedE thiosulfate transporter family protein [Polaromonas sp.]